MPRVIDFQSDPGVIWDLYPTFSGDVAFDVGANGGMVSAILAKNFKLVVAYEPHPDSYPTLSELGPPVMPANFALSDQEGEVELILTEIAGSLGEFVTGDSLARIWGQPAGKRHVRATTLDHEVEIWGAPDFIKIDTEGHEVKVIEGGLELFAAHSPRLLIEVHAAENEEAIRALLPAYDLTRIDHPYYEPATYERDNHFFLVSV